MKTVVKSVTINKAFISCEYLPKGVRGEVMSKKILICDDTMFMRTVLKNLLSESGYEVVGEAENGKIAIKKFKEFKPDLVLMDITMPEMDGIEALQEIMKIDSTAKVIMCSAMGQEKMVAAAIKGGAKDFVVKPFENERVIQAITNIIGN